MYRLRYLYSSLSKYSYLVAEMVEVFRAKWFGPTLATRLGLVDSVGRIPFLLLENLGRERLIRLDTFCVLLK